MPTDEKISLKIFWETVEAQLAGRSADQLRAILRTMAHETPPAERSTFLHKLQPVAAADIDPAQLIGQDELLADIDDFLAELQDTLETAEYWEEQDGWNDYYDDEDSLGPYLKLVQPLSQLFDRVAATFDYGHLHLAQEAYLKLFEVLSLEDEYGRGIRAHDLTGVNLNEAGARCLRAVYEDIPLPQRPAILFAAMHSGLTHTRPMLADLIQISPHPLPEQAAFMPAWITYLRTQPGPEADRWLREAVRLSQGVAGLETLARTEGVQRPRAYLDWFSVLAAAGQHQAVLSAAQEALRTLPADLPIRAAVADQLCAAAAQLNQSEVLLAGRGEAFQAKPTLARLLDLWEAAPVGAERSRLMQQAAQQYAGYLTQQAEARQSAGIYWPGDDDLERPAAPSKTALTHARLLAGEVAAAHQLVAADNVLGWSSSSNAQGLVVAAVLVLLSGQAIGTLPPNLAQLWDSNLLASVGLWRFDRSDPLITRLAAIYRQQLGDELRRQARPEQYQAWCLDVAQRRVAAIVGNQHRKSYNKAALLTVACAEVLHRRNDPTGANRFIADIRDQFPRHRAFQTELANALRQMRSGAN